MSEELKPCPFCGGTNLSIETNSVLPDDFHDANVTCDDCDACGRHAMTLGGWLPSKAEARSEAVIAWNRRATPPAPVEGQALPPVRRKLPLTEKELADPEYMRGYVEGQNESFDEAMAFIDVLRAHLAQAQQVERDAGASKWLPIESAPRDGQAVLLTRTNAGGAWIGKYDPAYQSGYRPDNPWFSLMLNRDYMPKPLKSSEPTHWMPLPSAPKVTP